MQIEKKYNRIIDYLIMLILLSVSGFSVVRNIFAENTDSLIITAIIFFIVFIFNDLKKNKSKTYVYGLFYSIFFILILIFQAIIFNYFRIETIFGLFTRLFIAFFAVSILRYRFMDVYVKSLYYISIISLIVYIGQLIGLLQLELYLYGIGGVREPENNLIRNAAVFWEPGAYGGYLVIALIFNALFINKSVKNKENLIFIISLLTTFSTTSYISIIVFILFYVYSRKASKNTKITYTLFLVPLFIFIIKQDFILDKILKQYEVSLNYAESNTASWNSQRFISTYSDFQSFYSNPLIGSGLASKTKYANTDSTISTNGWISMLASFGVIGSYIYFLGTWKFFINFCNKYTTNKKIIYFIICLLILIGSSEAYFYNPFFWSVSLFGYIININDPSNINKSLEVT